MKVSRLNIGFAFGAIAIALRMASDWIFSSGGPRWYEGIQAAALLLGVTFLWRERETIFVRGGDPRRAVALGLWAVPLGFAAGLGDAWLTYGGPQWLTLERLVPAVLYNLFFPVVEELEFRGFALGWLLRHRVKTRTAFCIVVALSSLAHAHRFVPLGDLRSVLFTVGLAAWWVWIVLRTRNLIGSTVAHIGWNIAVLWPVLGAPGNIR